MAAITGTRELALRWPDGREERVPLSLLEAAASSLSSEDLFDQVVAWSQGKPSPAAPAPAPEKEIELTAESVAEFERRLTEYGQGDRSEQGLLSVAPADTHGALLSSDDLPDAWPAIPAHAALGLALRRIRHLSSLGTRIVLVDVKTAGGSAS